MRGSRLGQLAITVSRTSVLVATVALASGAARAADPAEPVARTFAQPSLRQSAFPAEKQVKGVSGPEVMAQAPAAPVAKVEPSWPKTLPDAKAEAEPPKAEAYSPQEIEAARAQCSALLKGLHVVVVEEAPMKAGSCGTPAPVQLISIGRNPQVALSPPVTVTCDVVAAMHKWVTQELQPLARKHLASQIIGIDTMSSYSCRNAYGRKRTNLSEHGRANAIDIRSFTTADAKETVVLNDWGPTGWEIRAQIAAANKAAAEKAANERIAAERAAKASQMATSSTTPAAPKGQLPAAAGQPSAPQASPATSIGSIVQSVPGLAGKLPGAAVNEEGRTGFGLMRPSHLGGPKVAADKSTASKQLTAPLASDAVSASHKAQFLRAAHDTACKIFGTTLGPETNLAHKNHFHVDMAERSRGNFCE